MHLTSATPQANNARPAFSPAALVTNLGNTLTSPMLNQVFHVKGIYKAGKGVNYNGSYYDSLKDEFSDTSITFVIPAILRQKLKDGQLIEAIAYLGKKQQAAGARIELFLNVTELLSRQEKVVDEKEQKALELIQRKAHAGYKDLRAAIKNKLYAQEPVNITIMIGQNAIIDNDIRHQLKDAAQAYNIEWIRINLSHASEIISKLEEYDEGEILVLSRGGGENIQLFNNPAITEAALNLQSVFVTAIGHHDDEPLLQKVADKAFITPTSLGQFLYDTYIHTLEETNHSKARMITDITRQVELNYQHRFTDLHTKLQETAQAYQLMRTTTEEERKEWTAALKKTKTTSRLLAAALIFVIVLLVVYCIHISR